MDAATLNALITKGKKENLIYISLNNGKVLYITEEMKKNGEFSIDGDFIKIVNHNFTANGMTDYKVRDVIEYHAIEFVECVVFAQDKPSLINLTSVKDFTTDRNYDITDNINAQETRSTLRVSHPNLRVTAGGSLTKEYEITMAESTLKVELSGENKQLGMAENVANMYVLPFNMDALSVSRTADTSKAEFEIKAIKKGVHEILVRIGNQELYFKVIVDSDDLLTGSEDETVPDEAILSKDDEAIVTKDEEYIVSKDNTSTESEQRTETQSDETNEEEPVATAMLLDDTVIDLGLDGATQVTIAKGGSLQLNVTVTPEQELTISSSNSNVIVDENGLVTVVENPTTGQATLTIKATDGTTAKLKVNIG